MVGMTLTRLLFSLTLINTFTNGHINKIITFHQQIGGSDFNDLNDIRDMVLYDLMGFKGLRTSHVYALVRVSYPSIYRCTLEGDLSLKEKCRFDNGYLNGNIIAHESVNVHSYSGVIFCLSFI